MTNQELLKDIRAKLENIGNILQEIKHQDTITDG